MALEEADLTQIAELLSAKLADVKKEILQGANDGITKRLSAAEKAQEAALQKALEGIKVKPSVDDGTPKPPPDYDLKLRSLEAVVKESNSKVEEAERRAKAATEKQRAATLRSSTADALSKAGITNPVMNDLAVGHLIDVSKRVSWEDDNEENDRRVFKDDSGQAIDFGTGLAQWLKSETAKHLMPPKGVRGSGSQASGSGTRQQTQEEILFQRLHEDLRKM